MPHASMALAGRVAAREGLTEAPARSEPPAWSQSPAQSKAHAGSEMTALQPTQAVRLSGHCVLQSTGQDGGHVGFVEEPDRPVPVCAIQLAASLFLQEVGSSAAHAAACAEADAAIQQGSDVTMTVQQSPGAPVHASSDLEPEQPVDLGDRRLVAALAGR